MQPIPGLHILSTKHLDFVSYLTTVKLEAFRRASCLQIFSSSPSKKLCHSLSNNTFQFLFPKKKQIGSTAKESGKYPIRLVAWQYDILPGMWWAKGFPDHSINNDETMEHIYRSVQYQVCKCKLKNRHAERWGNGVHIYTIAVWFLSMIAVC